MRGSASAAAKISLVGRSITLRSRRSFSSSRAHATRMGRTGSGHADALPLPARAGISVAEYAPNLVKKTIVGAGHCEKEQIRLMLRVLLPKADPPTHDAADALAIAVCHAHHRQSAALALKIKSAAG